jgi:NAD(P)-dependent dehydrogenase (short-subunit alcohol dehydrogenase family)
MENVMAERQQRPSAAYPSLRERTVIVTGGAHGIGRSMVEEFRAQGSLVWFLDRDVAAGEALATILNDGTHAPVRFVVCDMLDIDRLTAVIADIGRERGEIGVLINNAGEYPRHDWRTIDADYWDGRLEINLRHMFFAAREASLFMQPGATIVNFSSTTAIRRTGGAIGYVTAKAGVIGLTNGLARDLGEAGVRVNCVVPGMVETEQNFRQWVTPAFRDSMIERQCLKEITQPRDIARVVLFLASEESAMITGQSIVVDGGV